MRRRRIPLIALAVVLGALGVASPAVAAPAAVPPGAAPTGCVNAGMCRAVGLPVAETSLSGTRAGGTQRALTAPAAADCGDGSGAECGTVTVPVDYREPKGEHLEIAWRLFRHTAPGAAVSTTAFLSGGPGISSISQGSDDAPYILGDSFAAHDVLLVDARGRGASGPLVCDALQHGTGTLATAVRACGAQLGTHKDDYTAAYAARDLERVRTAIGVQRLDLVGLSYGAMESIAYATRFPSHVRSLVLASGATPTFNDFRFEVTQSALSGRRVQTDLCRRSSHCNEIGKPLDRLALAAAALRRHPLVGSAPDPEGVLRRTTVTQNTLVRAARMDSQTLAGWVLPAANAYLHGDPAPLLRLSAARDWEERFQDSGDPAEYSAAVNLAEYCTDKTHLPWRDGATTQQRLDAATRFAAAVPSAAFFPWSGTAMVADPATSTIGALDYCLDYPDTPAAEGVLPAHPVFGDFPVLALVGSDDSLVDETSTIADASRFAHHQVVRMTGGDHLSPYYVCPEVTRAFVDSLGRAPACDTVWHWFLQPSFPKRLADVPTTGITRAAGDESTSADRRIAAATWRTFLDGWIQEWDRPDFITSKGLRGGALYDSDDGESNYFIDFNDYRYVHGLGITGRLTAPFDERPSTGTFRLSGVDGTLTITARLSLDRDGAVAIDGTVGGRAIHLTTSSF